VATHTDCSDKLSGCFNANTITPVSTATSFQRRIDVTFPRFMVEI